MKKIIGIIVLMYYSIGALILPLSDFSIIPDLPEMYSHCKTSEDKDMTMIDFITDHLVNIDGLFDKHDCGDEQKQHKPFEHKVNIASNFIAIIYTSEISIPQKIIDNNIVTYNQIYQYDFVESFLRPPIS